VLETLARTSAPSPSRERITQLLGGVSRGDTTAFGQLYAATSAKLYGIVVRLVGRRDLADEVLQETYLRIWKHAARFDPARSSPITWMVVIARNCALDEGRREASRAKCARELLQAPLDSDAGEDHEMSEDASKLHACLLLLEPEKRAAIVQAYCFGMSRKDIASKMGHPESTIKTWLRRGLAELRSYLDEHQTKPDSVGTALSNQSRPAAIGRMSLDKTRPRLRSGGAGLPA
jgi:RNA polymerase sigma-70 factor (ECF subfamily)